ADDLHVQGEAVHHRAHRRQRSRGRVRRLGVAVARDPALAGPADRLAFAPTGYPRGTRCPAGSSAFGYAIRAGLGRWLSFKLLPIRPAGSFPLSAPNACPFLAISN